MSLAKNYNFVDKTLHHLAFSGSVIRNIISDLETSLYKKELSNVESNNEVFVSGLPRSGTTLVLELLYKSNEFSTFSYRHMPFLYSPLLWKKLSSPFSKTAESVERAHGDGMEVSFDSPEAFEEAIWLSYLEDNYVGSDHLKPLSLKTTSSKFARNFQLIIKKLLLETGNDGKVKRYISKNNANCSRVSVIQKLFPTATLIMPFREPLAHIGSLMKQHRQFCELHDEDKFSQHYMRWLGHFDFGENFKPINFNQWLDSLSQSPNYGDENFWLEYWIAAYTDMLSNRQSNVHLLDFDKLLQNPAESLASLADAAKMGDKTALIEQSKTIRTPTSKPKSSDSIRPELLNKAMALYAQLQEAAL